MSPDLDFALTVAIWTWTSITVIAVIGAFLKGLSS